MTTINSKETVDRRDFARYHVKDEREIVYLLQNSKSETVAVVYMADQCLKFFERHINPGNSVGGWKLVDASVKVSENSFLHRTAVVLENSKIFNSTILQGAVIKDKTIKDGDYVIGPLIMNTLLRSELAYQPA